MNLSRIVNVDTFKRLGYVILAAFILRIVYLTLAVADLGIDQLLQATFDSRDYLLMANSLFGNEHNAETQFSHFGVGYPLFLALTLAIGGPWCTIMLQVLMSCATVAMIYYIGEALGFESHVSLIASAIVALSFTSVNLSVLILSESLFLFLFTLSVCLFFLSLRKISLSLAVISGAVLGYAILTRSIAQFWPVCILALGAISVYANRTTQSSFRSNSALRKTVTNTVVVCLVSILVVSVWVVRNYNRIGIPTLTFSSAGGPANVALWTLESEFGTPSHEIRSRWLAEIPVADTSSREAIAQRFRLYADSASAILSRMPGSAFAVYATNVRRSIIAHNGLYSMTTPSLSEIISRSTVFYAKKGLHYLPLVLSIFGGVVLARRRQWLCLSFALMCFLYFAGFSGFSRDQGSRLFHPGILGWSLLSGVALLELRRLLQRVLVRFRRLDAS